MADPTPAPARDTARETGSLVLAIGGLAAGFGAASCCALPMLLGSLGIGSAGLFGVAILAAPHRLALVTAAIVFLIGAAVIFVLHRRAIAYAQGTVCAHRAITPLVLLALCIGAGLTVAGYLFA